MQLPGLAVLAGDFQRLPQFPHIRMLFELQSLRSIVTTLFRSYEVSFTNVHSSDCSFSCPPWPSCTPRPTSDNSATSIGCCSCDQASISCLRARFDAAKKEGFPSRVHVYLKVKEVPRQSQVCSHTILSISISEDAKMTSLSTSLIIHGDLTKVADFYGTVFAPNVTILSAPTSVSTNNLQSAILQIYGHNFTIFNLGPDEKPSPATSFMITCDNGQEEVDTLWYLFLHFFVHWQLILM